MRTLSRLIIGLLFVFSGFVKIIDPVGSALVISEYLTAFSLDFLTPFSMAIGFLRDVFELLLGVLILLDFRRLWTAWGALLFMSVFTLLTLYLALFNPVSDCGCFGEAIKLTNWQTFAKNIFFLPFTIHLFISRHRKPSVASPALEWSVCALFALFSATLSLYCYRHLPLLDFMGFKVGNHIPTLLEQAREHPAYTFETQLIYTKEGKDQAFTVEQLPDSTWTFVESKTREIATGYSHKVTDFSVRTEDGEIIGDQLLSNPNTSLALVITSENQLNAETLAPLKPILQQSRLHDTPMYVLSALIPDKVRPVLEEAALDIPIYLLDRKTLLTMVRSTPGLVVFHNGRVIGKFSWRDIPSAEKWSEWTEKDPELVTAQFRIRNNLRVEILIVVFFLVLFAIRKGIRVFA